MLLIVSMAVLQIDEEECSRFFDIARTTVERWVWGAKAPMGAMRIPIWNTFKEKIIKAGEEFENTTEKDEPPSLEKLNKKMEGKN